MKRFYALGMVFLLSMPIQAAEKNKISMVTYFPVPYVAYSQVNVTEQMDIGLTSTCNMKLGCTESLAPTLEAGQVNLNRGKLNLDGGLGITGNVLDLGSGSGEGKISFRNVRIQTGHMESVNAQDITVDTLELFGKPFPSCKDANNKSNGQMQWASLKLKGASSNELYLMCGNLGESTTCQPTDPRGATYTENCPSGQTGKITYTWNSSTCRYDKNDSSCISGNKAYLTNFKCMGLEKELRGGEFTNLPDCNDVKSREDLVWKKADVSGYLSSGFKKIPDGCSPGKECPSCEIGEKYVSTWEFPARSCHDVNENVPADRKMLLVVKYVKCQDTRPSGSSVSACECWSDIENGGGKEDRETSGF